MVTKDHRGAMVMVGKFKFAPSATTGDGEHFRSRGVNEEEEPQERIDG